MATDSRTVVSWLDNTSGGRDRVRTKSAAQMLIRRRLMVIKDIITEYQLDVSFRFVTTMENKADPLTRVTKSWLGHQESGGSVTEKSVAAAVLSKTTLVDAIWAAHLRHHFGVDRTFYLAKRFRSDLARDQVRRTIRGCEACQRIDSAARSENLVGQGNLAVERDWSRLAADVTYYEGVPYLSLVDCGPSRFAIWRRLSDETAAKIVANLQQVVIERGPFVELLLDNATAFRSTTVDQFAKQWGISLRFRAAYAPSGNGIIERNHRTIKRIAARGKVTPEEATFWYNVTPRKDVDKTSIPSKRLFRYPWRLPSDVNMEVVDDGKSGAFAVGDEVWLKPAVPSCTKKWTPGVVTEVQSSHVVCVDGMPRHVRDVRKRHRTSDSSVTDGYSSDDDAYDHPEAGGQDEGSVDAGSDHRSGTDQPSERDDFQGAGAPVENVESPEAMPRRSSRVRQPPRWMDDYVS